MERHVRQHGTSIKAEDLDGRWMLQNVWPKGSIKTAALSNWSLRGLQARLDITAVSSQCLQIRNAVRLGPLELRFEGEGALEGPRPLLTFSFNRLELHAWDRLVIQRSLDAPAPGRRPFFALINRDTNGWLAARGRGGGLALWSLDQKVDNGQATSGHVAPIHAS